MQTRTADHIYEQLKTLRYQLEQLSEQGRIVMSKDSLNTGNQNTKAATMEALAGMDQAINALVWMETIATTDGEYPVLKD